MIAEYAARTEAGHYPLPIQGIQQIIMSEFGVPLSALK